MTTTATPIVVDDRTCAAALGMSIHWVRKDRVGKQLLPFFRLGTCVRYNLDRCREAWNALEIGGPKAAS